MAASNPVDMGIYPAPLTNLVVKQGSITLSPTLYGDYYICVVDADGDSITIQCDEYNDYAFSIEDDFNFSVYVGNLYAWNTTNSEVVYTSSPIPVQHDSIYDQDGFVPSPTTVVCADSDGSTLQYGAERTATPSTATRNYNGDIINSKLHTNLYAWSLSPSISSDITISDNIYLDTYAAIYTIDEEPTQESAVFLPNGVQIFPTFFFDVDGDYLHPCLQVFENTGIYFTNWNDIPSEAHTNWDGWCTRDSTKDFKLATHLIGPKLYAFTTNDPSTAATAGVPSTIYLLTGKPSDPAEEVYFADQTGKIITGEFVKDAQIRNKTSTSFQWYKSSASITITYNRDTSSDKKLNKIIVPLHCWCPTSNGSTYTSTDPVNCYYTKKVHPGSSTKLYNYLGEEDTDYKIRGYSSTVDDCIDIYGTDRESGGK